MDLRRWWRRRPSADEVREEIESHLAMRAEHDGAGGTHARRRFGNVVRTAEDVRRVWVPAWMEVVRQDLRFTWRGWRRHPGFAFAAMLTLAVGLGAATALFSVVDPILFRSLPYPDADRLVSVGVLLRGSAQETMPDRGYQERWHPAPAPFEAVTTIQASGAPCDVTDAPAERLSCARVEANLLDVLGRAAALGRDFTRADDVPGAPRVALIRHGLWVRRFSADPAAIGKTLTIDGVPTTIVGVLPADFEPPVGSADVFLPQQLHIQAFTRFLVGIGRLARHATVAEARAAAESILMGTLAEFPASMRTGARVQVRSLRDREVGDAPRTAWLLVAATAAFLLIVCVNVAALLVARTETRRREFAVRAALGAGRRRLVRLTVTESLALAVVAGALGLGVATALCRVVVALAPAGIPGVAHAALDMRALAVSLGLVTMVGVGTALWPAVTVARSSLVRDGRLADAPSARFQFVLVALQIAVTVALVGGATLFARSLANLARVPLGFDPSEVVTMSATLNAVDYRAPARQLAFANDLLDRVGELPGTVAVTLSDAPPPIGQMETTSGVSVEGWPERMRALGGDVRVRSVTTRYFDVFQIPVVAGRAFVDADANSGDHPVVLSESAARLIFRGESALGRRIQYGEDDAPWRVVVGVVGDVHNAGPAAAPQPELYALQGRTADAATRWIYLAMRTTAGDRLAARFLRGAATELDPHVVATIETTGQQMAALSSRPRFIAWLVGAFALMALALAAAGLYGVTSFLVTRRTRDIGVRLALGATPRQIAREVAGDAGRWVAAGTLGGLVLAAVSGRAIAAQLFGLAAGDARSWALAVAILWITLAIALLAPAIRAARVDPVISLRAD